MSEPHDTPPSTTAAQLLDSVFFAPLREALAKIRTRSCRVLEDLDFVLLAVARVLQENASGRDFFQTHALPAVPDLKCHGYFKNLKSDRRLRILEEADRFMREHFLPLLRASDDRLAGLPGLDGWEVWAGDGHAIEHATHDARNAEWAHRAVKAIYRLDLRTGWAGFLDLQQPTDKDSEHEITTLKRLDRETLRCGAPKGVRVLWVYDSAVVDFQHAYNIKCSKGVYTLTDWKANLRPLHAIALPVDRDNPLNDLVVADELVSFDNQPGQWRRITVIDPDTGGHRMLLTNEMTLAPGVLNQVRRLRWNIEKMFSEQECKLGEDKAWTAAETGKRVQAMAICIACNLLRLFHDKLRREEGIEDTKVVKAWNQRLAARVAKAAELGRPFPESLYKALYRPTEVSLQFLRWLRYALTRATCYRAALARLRPLMEKYL